LVKDAQDALDEVEDLWDDGNIDLSVEANTEEFDEAMEALLDANYAVDIELHTQAEQEFDSLVTAMNDIEEKASLIGEDFIVAADDIRELNNTFPGIIDNMIDLKDGTV
jgi:uncharacterized protein (DUF1697 family)